MRYLLGLCTLLLVVRPVVASADGWLVAEAPAAVALSDAQQGVFRPGLMPAIGAYLDNGRLAVGLRLRAGILRNGPAPGDELRDPGVGGLGTVGLALRLHAGGAWTELVAGGGVTGHDLVPAFEGGVGWTFHVGSIDLGPSARYVRVVSQDSMASFGTAELLLVGVDVLFGVDRPRVEPIHYVATPPPPPPPVEVPVDRDPDEIVEHESSCAIDPDGCVLAEGIVMHGDRITLDDRVLFDFNNARVKSAGRELIARLAKVWRQHPDWKHVTIEGHTDSRGTDEYNQWLSELRAQRTRAVFVRNGFTEDQIDAVGYGRTRPVDLGTSEDAHQRNRRVEFVIDREVAP